MPAILLKLEIQRYSKILLQLSEHLISQENVSVEINNQSSEIIMRPAT